MQACFHAWPQFRLPEACRSLFQRTSTRRCWHQALYRASPAPQAPFTAASDCLLSLLPSKPAALYTELSSLTCQYWRRRGGRLWAGEPAGGAGLCGGHAGHPPRRGCRQQRPSHLWPGADACCHPGRRGRWHPVQTAFVRRLRDCCRQLPPLLALLKHCCMAAMHALDCL